MIEKGKHSVRNKQKQNWAIHIHTQRKLESRTPLCKYCTALCYSSVKGPPETELLLSTVREDPQIFRGKPHYYAADTVLQIVRFFKSIYRSFSIYVLEIVRFFKSIYRSFSIYVVQYAKRGSVPLKDMQAYHSLPPPPQKKKILRKCKFIMREKKLGIKSIYIYILCMNNKNKL